MSGVQYNNVEKSSSSTISKVLVAIGIVTFAGVFANVGLVHQMQKDVDSLVSGMVPEHAPMSTKSPMSGTNTCDGKKKTIEDYFTDAGSSESNLANGACVDAITDAIEQAGGNVTKGYTGGMAVTDVPLKTPYYQQGLCPVNVHWHLGAEHLSVGEYDGEGSGPGTESHRKLLAEGARLGGRCHKYDSSVEMFTKEYDWQHCVGMKVGETYEVHWPHSAAGACGTPNQYQTPFYDGVLCNIADGNALVDDVINGAGGLQSKVGVQAQVFTIVNDENYYYPDLMRGMIVDGDKGKEITYYTGSTTGTSRDNTVCSKWSPITWQVDRTCHLISASTFDKMCADMKSQRDDMSDDLYAHGAREVTADDITANNQDFDGKR